MNRKAFIMVVTLLLFSLNTIIGDTQTEENPKEKEKIELENKQQMIHRVSLINVEAYHDGSTIELYVDNYNGFATLSILNSSLHLTVEINDTGYATMDISQLPEGNYILQVTIGNTIFEGDFHL